MPSITKSLSPFVVLPTACALLLGGCVPGTHVDASPVAGQVVDRATGQPIAGAKVAVSTFSPDHKVNTQTEADGRFRLAGFRHVEWTPLPYGFFRAPTGHLHVEAAGYRPYDCGEFYDQNGKHPGYFNRESVVGTEQLVQVTLARDKRQ